MKNHSFKSLRVLRNLSFTVLFLMLDLVLSAQPSQQIVQEAYLKASNPGQRAGISQLKLRFLGTMNKSDERANLDNLRVMAH